MNGQLNLTGIDDLPERSHALSSWESIKRFVLGGNATFTVRAIDSGKHFTYRVTAADKRNPDADDMWFVSVGISYDDSIYAGMIFAARNGTHQLRLTQKSKVTDQSPSWKAFRWFWAALDIDTPENELSKETRYKRGTIEFYHVGKCCMCGRPLTNPESIEAGIGPDCAAKEQE